MSSFSRLSGREIFLLLLSSTCFPMFFSSLFLPWPFVFLLLFPFNTATMEATLATPNYAARPVVYQHPVFQYNSRSSRRSSTGELFFLAACNFLSRYRLLGSPYSTPSGLLYPPWESLTLLSPLVPFLSKYPSLLGPLIVPSPSVSFVRFLCTIFPKVSIFTCAVAGSFGVAANHAVSFWFTLASFFPLVL